MATKTITIKEEAYRRLKALKNDRSFSDTILELTEGEKPDLMESFGVLSDEEVEKAREKMGEFREGFEGDFSEKVQS